MLGKRLLRKELARLSRKRVAINLSEAKSIGILFNMQGEPDFDMISCFTRELVEFGKKVQVLGLHKFNKLPPYYAQKLSFDLVTPSVLDLFYRPKSEFVSSFLNQEFDMLIDLCSESDFQMHYIACLSKASFKIGRFSEGEFAPYDLIIEDQSADHAKFIRELVHYTSSFRFVQS